MVKIQAEVGSNALLYPSTFLVAVVVTKLLFYKVAETVARYFNKPR